jgi:hypothetical protein
MLASATDISSMIENCNKIHGETCYNFNHEGQWLLSAEINNLISAGKMCPMEKIDKNTTSVAESIISHWSKYWQGNKPYLLEKSPHSMLKIPLMYSLFKDRFDLRFIVVIKVRKMTRCKCRIKIVDTSP